MPDNPDMADTLGWIHYKKQAYAKAVGVLKESAHQAASNPVVRYHLGMAYDKNGDRALARFRT